MALGLTQPVTEMSTRNTTWVGERRGGGIKAAGDWGWQHYHLHVPIVLKSGSLTSWKTQGLSRPVQVLLYILRNNLPQ
jgi:hypothetical protein